MSPGKWPNGPTTPDAVFVRCLGPALEPRRFGEKKSELWPVGPNGVGPLALTGADKVYFPSEVGFWQGTLQITSAGRARLACSRWTF